MDSGGKPDAELTSVNRPVPLSSENVVTEPVSSLSTYTNLLSLDVMKWRGPSAGFIRKTAGVFEARCPVLESNVNWNISSLPSVGTNTNLLLVRADRVRVAAHRYHLQRLGSHSPVLSDRVG